MPAKKSTKSDSAKLLEKLETITATLAQVVEKLANPAVVTLESIEQTTGRVEQAETDKLDDLELANGKVNDAERTQALEQALGIHNTNPFGTTDQATFEARLTNMSAANMQALASKIGISPYEQIPILRNNLLAQFKAKNHVGAFNKTPAPKHKILNPTDPQDRVVMAALGMKF